MKKIDYTKLSKIFVIIYMCLTFINLLLPDEFVIGINSLPYRPDPIQAIIRWFNYSAFVVLPIAVYFNRSTFIKIATYFCLPVAVIYMFFYQDIIACYTSELGRGICQIRYLPDVVSNFMYNGIFRSILFFGILFFQIGTVVLLLIKDWTVINFKKEDILPFIILLPLMIITIIPTYTLEAIFNTQTDLLFDSFSLTHICWIILLVAEIVICTLLFKNRQYEDKYILVLILAISLLLQFNQLFSSLGELTCKRMPFQLCNIASYTIIVSVISKNRKLFLFNILVNVAGGIIALFVMDVERNGILNKSNMHYILEHHNVIITPLLCLILGVFKPIEKKDYKNFIIAFTSYYVFVFVLGTIFNTLRTVLDSDYFYCNYMFMFDKSTAARIVPFTGQLFDIQLKIGPVTLYPVIQLSIYLVFVLIGTIAFIILKHAVKEKNLSTN